MAQKTDAKKGLEELAKLVIEVDTEDKRTEWALAHWDEIEKAQADSLQEGEETFAKVQADYDTKVAMVATVELANNI